MATILDTKLIDLLPDTLRKQDEIRWICAAIQPEIDEIVEIITTKILFTNLDKLDDLTLDYLLVERGIANSIENVFIQTRQDKINFIQSYTKLKKLKGTKAGVKYALNKIGITANILEWFEYDGDPYTFQISLPSAVSFTPEKIELLDSFIQQYKNTRSWVSYIQNINFDTKPYVAFATKINILMEDRQ